MSISRTLPIRGLGDGIAVAKRNTPWQEASTSNHGLASDDEGPIIPSLPGW
jgi:hypothetical protein